LKNREKYIARAKENTALNLLRDEPVNFSPVRAYRSSAASAGEEGDKKAAEPKLPVDG
jgi:hypothetical protein